MKNETKLKSKSSLTDLSDTPAVRNSNLVYEDQINNESNK